MSGREKDQDKARAPTVLLVLALGASLAGCASYSEELAPAFIDPAKYNLYECKQLAPERKNLASRVASLQGLMSKAEQGVGGAVVAEMAYRGEYITARGQARLAEEAWQRNRCDSEITDAPKPAATAAPPAGSVAAPPVQGDRSGRSIPR